MDSIINVSIKYNDSVTQGEVIIVNNYPSERLRLAAKLFFFSILGVIVSVFIPMLHFVLVPLFLLASVIVPLFVYFKKSYVKCGTGACPSCNESIKIKPTNNHFPIYEICINCNQHVSVWKENQ